MKLLVCAYPVIDLPMPIVPLFVRYIGEKSVPKSLGFG
jgi:hypothetical protein